MEFPECWVLLVIPGALKKRLRPTVVPNLKAHGKFQLELPHAEIQCLRRIKQIIPGNGFLGSKHEGERVLPFTPAREWAAHPRCNQSARPAGL